MSASRSQPGSDGAAAPLTSRKYSLYESGWSPRGTRKAWDRSLVTLDNISQVLGHWHDMTKSEAIEAVGWFDDEGAMRVLIVDYASGRRLEMRRLSRSTVVTFSKTPSQHGTTDRPTPVPGRPS